MNGNNSLTAVHCFTAQYIFFRLDCKIDWCCIFFLFITSIIFVYFKNYLKLDNKTNLTLTFDVLLEAESAVEFYHRFVQRNILSRIVVRSAVFQHSIQQGLYLVQGQGGRSLALPWQQLGHCHLGGNIG